ncbi:MAG: hypothetical protein EZS28_000145 [Streblomastix strix]|uniref:Uncharacterized protein n=1 Tax=Streblomastix strix TaxID=222440 RepID=A0A5J4XAV1_9EUKA|nr:MAG: hypothetical protein EZS28_000145 [Streblomastix strix]
MYGDPQFREDADDDHATLIGQLCENIKKIDSEQEQDLDENEANPENVVEYNKKKKVIYTVNGYTTAVRLGDKYHIRKRNQKKKYYIDFYDLERTALIAKLKQQGIKRDPYMK